MIPTWYIALIPEAYEYEALDRFARAVQLEIPEIEIPRPPRHLTIIPPFKAPTSVAAKALIELRALVEPFTANTEGWWYFQEHRSWYLRIQARQEFIELENAGRERLAGRGLIPPIEPRIHHITLAKDKDKHETNRLMAALLTRQKPPVSHLRFAQISLVQKQENEQAAWIISVPFS